MLHFVTLSLDQNAALNKWFLIDPLSFGNEEKILQFYNRVHFIHFIPSLNKEWNESEIFFSMMGFDSFVLEWFKPVIKLHDEASSCLLVECEFFSLLFKLSSFLFKHSFRRSETKRTPTIYSKWRECEDVIPWTSISKSCVLLVIFCCWNGFCDGIQLRTFETFVQTNIIQ
jgi:hypothetical protein